MNGINIENLVSEVACDLCVNDSDIIVSNLKTHAEGLHRFNILIGQNFDTQLNAYHAHMKVADESKQNGDILSACTHRLDAYYIREIMRFDTRRAVNDQAFNPEKTAAMNASAASITAILAQSGGAICRYLAMTTCEYYNTPSIDMLADNHGARLSVGSEYMVIICDSGYKYYVNVTCDSVLTACAETLRFAAMKL